MAQSQPSKTLLFYSVAVRSAVVRDEAQGLAEQSTKREEQQQWMEDKAGGGRGTTAYVGRQAA